MYKEDPWQAKPARNPPDASPKAFAGRATSPTAHSAGKPLSVSKVKAAPPNSTNRRRSALPSDRVERRRPGPEHHLRAQLASIGRGWPERLIEFEPHGRVPPSR